MNNEKNYICIHCGHSVRSLYKQYSDSLLRLLSCGNCGNILDKYLEFDRVVILIDMILFSKEAYRHVLYNTKYKSHIKMAILELMVITYDEYDYALKSVKLQESERFFEAKLYYLIMAIVSGKLLLFLVLSIFLYIYMKFIFKKSFIKNNLIKIWEAMIFSSFGYFLLLTIIIWDDFQREIHKIFVTVYIILCQVQALAVTTEVPQPFLGIICTLATTADYLFTTFLKWNFGI